MQRILGVDAHLDRVAAEAHVGLRVAELLAGGDADLLAHQIDPRHHLGHRVLHLQARVHLEEVELALRPQEFDRARVLVTDRARGGESGRAHALAHGRRRSRPTGDSSISFW